MPPSTTRMMVTRLHALVVQVLPDRNVSLMVSSTSGVATRRYVRLILSAVTKERTCGGCDGYWRALSVVKVLSVISVQCAHYIF